MVDCLFADISEFQPVVDDRYPYRFLSFRCNDGTYADHHFTANLRWADHAASSRRIVGYLTYFVWETNWQETIGVLKTQLGRTHRPQMAIMIDVERWGNKITGDHSFAINAARAELIDWLHSLRPAWQRRTPLLNRWYLAQDTRRVIGYANAADFAEIWPAQARREVNVVLASYGTNPDFPRKIAHQFSSSFTVPPFGTCDINSADGLSPAQFAAALGLAGPSAPLRRRKPKPAPKRAPDAGKHRALGQAYTVRSGDTLAQIAARYGTNWARLARLNSLADPNRLYVGQTLRVN